VHNRNNIFSGNGLLGTLISDYLFEFPRGRPMTNKTMISPSKRTFAKIGALSMAYGFPGASINAQASAFPNKPIRLIVPSAAGGAPDAICRLLATELTAAWGQTVLVDNKPGAGGAIGLNDLSRSQPDGYTLAYANVVTLAINRSLYAKLSYDPDSFTGLALLGTVQNALVVRNELPVKSVRDLIAYAKSRPGKLNMGSAGTGTTGHLGGELFKAMTGTFITHVPYRGSVQAIQDLIGGQIDLMFDNLSSIGPHIKSGRVTALAVSGLKRSALFPSLPTVQEAGVTDYETTAWGGIVGPKGMTTELANQINQEINKVLSTQATREKYSQMSFEVNSSTPNAIMQLAKSETPKWADVVRRSGATAQ
jgi:tripartite-type tricarboxylate transporter receptor subunit TctC